MFKKLKQGDKSGFTIIEVMIVLAIAGVIIGIVLATVPALNRSSRNTQRKNDASSLLSAIQTAINNNGGTLPPTGSGNTVSAGFTGLGLDWSPKFYDSSKAYYYNNGSGTVTVPTPTVDTIYVETNAKCSSATTLAQGDSSRGIAVLYAIEGGGSSVVNQCIQI